MKVRDKINYGFYLFLKGFDLPFLEKIRVRVLCSLLKVNLQNLIVRSNVSIHGHENLKIGNDVSINHGCFLSAEGGLEIGNYVSIGHNTSIITTEHSYTRNDIPIKQQPINKKPVCLKDNIWIGANVTILAGVSLAEGTIIAAGAVVNKSVDEINSIIGGVPAKHIKFYK
jgi:acetyltransferase-like isoleucine patch superfamily enzyme